jgi:DNA helicase HerA-like ATPase
MTAACIGIVIGVPGSGKSHFLRDLVRYAGGSQCRILVHDPMHDWLTWAEREGPYPEGVTCHADLEAEEFASMAIRQAPCTVIFDELALALPCMGKPSPTTEDIVTRGRHLGVGIIGATQRPVLIGGTIRALHTWVVCFQVTSANDLTWLERNISETLPEKVRLLTIGQFAVYPPI